MAINIYTVAADAEQNGWTLVSDTYKNLKTPLDFICPKGHLVNETYENWRKHHTCQQCERAVAPKLARNSMPPRTDKNAFRVIALDAATGTTGYSIYDDKTLVAYGTFNTHGEEPAARINQVKHWLDKMCRECKPDAIGIEGIQYQTNVKMFQTLANLQGVIQDYLYENRDKYKYKFANSSSWRSYLGINKGDKRETAKQQAQSYVKLMYRINATQDEADAICMGKYFANHFNAKKEMSWGEDIL